MILRDATLADAAALATLGRESIVATFGHLYSPENLQKFLAEVYSVPAVQQEIADPLFTHQLALDAPAGPLTGFIKLRQPSIYAEYSDASAPLALCQLYTAPARTGEGIGAALMEWALAYAQRQACDAVHLSVWSENFGAQRFYQRYGFCKIADIAFWVGDHKDDELLYELRL